MTMKFQLCYSVVFFSFHFFPFFPTLKQIAVGKDPLSELQQHHSYDQDQFRNIIPVFVTCIILLLLVCIT